MRLDSAVRLVSLLIAFVPKPVSVDPHVSSLPRVDRVEPATAKPGALVTGFGVNLMRSCVQDVILSREATTALTQIHEQQENLIRFRIPRSLAAGHYRLVLVISHGWTSELLEQQTFIRVGEEEHVTLRLSRFGANDAPQRRYAGAIPHPSGGEGVVVPQ
jgi:hypothetical protein